jgi:hypothetical protein
MKRRLAIRHHRLRLSDGRLNLNVIAESVCIAQLERL